MGKTHLITAIANDLLKQYRIVSNSLNFNPELGDAVYSNGDATLFNRSLGEVPSDSATGTNVGNVPVFTTVNGPKTEQSPLRDMDAAKLAGQEAKSTSGYLDYTTGMSYSSNKGFGD